MEINLSNNIGVRQNMDGFQVGSPAPKVEHAVTAENRPTASELRLSTFDPVKGSEPTTHAMQDIAAFRKEFEASNLPLIFIFSDKADYDKFKLKNFSELPDGITYGLDDGTIRDDLVESLNLNSDSRPIFIIANANSEVVFVKQGYTIGLGEQMLKVMAKMQQ